MCQYPDQSPESEASGAANPPSGASPKRQPRPEKVRHVLYGTVAGLDRTIKILHTRGYADPNDWSDPVPSGEPNQWLVVMTKILLVE